MEKGQKAELTPCAHGMSVSKIKERVNPSMSRTNGITQSPAGAHAPHRQKENALARLGPPTVSSVPQRKGTRQAREGEQTNCKNTR